MQREESSFLLGAADGSSGYPALAETVGYRVCWRGSSREVWSGVKKTAGVLRVRQQQPSGHGDRRADSRSNRNYREVSENSLLDR